MAFKCKFPLGPKGDLACALALLIWTNMWSVFICIMGRMEMRGQLCQPKTKRRKKKGRQTDAILLNCICATQRCDILSLICPLLIRIRDFIEYCHCHRFTKAFIGGYWVEDNETTCKQMTWACIIFLTTHSFKNYRNYLITSRARVWYAVSYWVWDSFHSCRVLDPSGYFMLSALRSCCVIYFEFHFSVCLTWDQWARTWQLVYN